MNNTEKCVLAERVLEGTMGAAIGLVLTNVVFPKCNNTAEKVLITMGTAVASWTAARVFGKTFFKFCENTIDDVDFDDVEEQL